MTTKFKTIVHEVNFKADDRLVDLITKKCEKLHKINDHITEINIYLKTDGESSIKDKIVEIKINTLHDPTTFIKKTSKTFEESFSKALKVSINSLKKKKEILKG
jgi:putative sigma-54 modulation protein